MDCICRRLFVAFLFALIAFSSGTAISQGGGATGFPISPRPRVLEARDGLPSSDVGKVSIDREGFVWVATSDGLARYDGTSFQIWRYDPSRRDGLRSNNISDIEHAADGRVWVATSRGLSVLDAGRKQFRTFLKAQYPAMGTDEIWNVALSGDEVWFGTASGLHRLSGDRIERFIPVQNDPHSLPGFKVISVLAEPGGTIWATTSGGLARWDGKRFHRYTLPGSAQNFALQLSPSRHGVWVATLEGLHLLASNGSWVSPAFGKDFAEPDIVASVVESQGEHWVLSYQGLWHVDALGRRTRIPLEKKFDSIRGSMLQQPDGSVWFSAGGFGVAYLATSWRRTQVYSRASGTLASEVIDDLAAVGDGVLVWGDAHRFESIGRPAGPDRSAAVASSLGGSRLRSFHADDAGRLWVGSSDRLLLAKGNAVRTWDYRSRFDPAIRGALSRIVADGRGGVWLAYEHSALQHRDGEGRVLQKIPLPNAVFQVGEDTIRLGPDGLLYAVTDRGLAVVDTVASRFEQVRDIAAGSPVSQFNFDRRGGLWLHRTDRLERYRSEGGGWRLAETFDAKQGVPVATANDLVTDARGRLWWSTARGIFRWDPVTRGLRRFGRADGFSSEEAFTRLVLTRGGMLVGGMADGSVVAIDTNAPDEPSAVPNLVISEVDVRRDGGWQVQDKSSVVLRPGDRELRVLLRLLAYQDPAANRYFTRLEGYDRTWVEHQGSDRGERIFANLPAGHYTLRARALDARGTAAREQVLRFQVLPVWWRTLWATAAFAVLAILLAWWSLHRYRVRLIRRAAWRQAKRERELAHDASLAKTRFLATLGHEVRTPMTGVLGMSELLLDTRLDATQRSYAEAIHGAGEHLVRLVNDALDLSRIESGKLELVPAAFDQHALVHEVAQLMRPLAQRKQLGFDVSLDRELPQGVLGDASRVRQILLNLLGNAIKFTEAGRVWLHVRAGRGGIVRFEIGDTGPGLNEEQKSRLFRRFEQAEGARTAARYGGSGLGLAICQELAAVMGGAISVQSAPGKGTRFVVELPLHETALPVVADPAESGLRAAARKVVLLVEDDSIVAEVISGLLRAQGHRVSHVLHGLAALQEMAATTFDIALLDLDLPGIDGFALARQLRAQGFVAPIVALTARADAEAQAMAQAAGFDRFLRKPVTGAMLARLFAELENALAEPA